MREYFLAITMISIFFGCSRVPKIESQAGKEENVISVLPKKEDFSPFELTPYLDTVKYVKLELSDESLIGSIDKVIIYDERIYILDKKTRSLFVYDLEGRYLHKIARVGQGPFRFVYYVYYSKESKNLISSFFFMFENVINLNYPQTGYESWIVYDIQSFDIIEWKERFPKDKISSAGRYTKARLDLAEELTDEDNPVLMFVKFKDF